jgi:hypothetical protein
MTKPSRVWPSWAERRAPHATLRDIEHGHADKRRLKRSLLEPHEARLAKGHVEVRPNDHGERNEYRKHGHRLGSEQGQDNAGMA